MDHRSACTMSLLHPGCCALCDQAEMINHLLTLCVFAWEFWFSLLQPAGPPQPDDVSFDEWWARGETRVDGEDSKGPSKVRTKMGLILSSPLEHGQFGNIKDNMCLMVHLLKWLEFFCSLERSCMIGVWPEQGASPTSLPLCQTVNSGSFFLFVWSKLFLYFS